MAVLPVDNTGLGTLIQAESEPSRTWFIDKDTNRIRGECDGYTAVRQAVNIILNTLRYKWQIYRPSSGVDYDNLIGLDVGYVAVELHRRIQEALAMDTRITNISNYEYSSDEGVLNVSFTVVTVYGDISESLEVSIE